MINMREKIGRAGYGEDEYGYSNILDRSPKQSRLNLNDLKKRIVEQEKNDRRNNILILSGVASVAVVVILTLTL